MFSVPAVPANHRAHGEPVHPAVPGPRDAGARQRRGGGPHLLQRQGQLQPLPRDDAQREEQDGRHQPPLLPHRAGRKAREITVF